MEKKFRYGTVTDAVRTLRKAGFNEDCRIEEDLIVCGSQRFGANDVSIAVVYRYEGDSDPVDEATVYGIESKRGLKGILIIADGIYSDIASTQVLKKLHSRKNKILAVP
ncbi:MAG: hypothetical protein ICV53_14575 [Flavisolibacter sp.]|nr:hypothetical protein [Flavisolibacter sp.]MBD0367314.1 hypothetical protein [Flavisolibacter sp.]